MNSDESFNEWWASLPDSARGGELKEVSLLCFKAGWNRGIEAERSDGR